MGPAAKHGPREAVREIEAPWAAARALKRPVGWVVARYRLESLAGAVFGQGVLN